MRTSIIADVPMPIPWWIEVLELSEEWGCKPWELVNEGSPALWVLRWRVWRREVASAQKTKMKHDGGA